MILSFSDFILESVSSAVKLIYSKSLGEFLYELSNSKDPDVSKFATYLLNRESKEIDIPFSFLDLTERNDMISFIQKNRIPDGYAHNRLNTNPAWSENRSEGKVGKIVKKISGSEFPDKVLEKFVNGFKSLFDFKFNLSGRFDLVSGEDIRKYYSEKNYEYRRGQLGNSCMRYGACQKYLDIYVKNPEVCQLLILRDVPDSEKISGRVLIWKDVSGIFFSDRVYTANDSDSDLMYKYIEERGWEKKYSYSREVKLKYWKFDYYPYMDTMSVLDNDGILTSDEDDWREDGKSLLKQTDGSKQSMDGMVYSDYSGEYIHEDDAVYIDGDWILRDDAIYLEYKGEHYHPNTDIVHSNHSGQDYLLEDAVRSDMLNDWIYEQDSIEIPILSRKEHIEYDNIPDSYPLVDVIIFEFPFKLKTMESLTLTNPSTGFRYLLGFVNVDDSGLTYKDGSRTNSEIGNDKIETKEYILSNVRKTMEYDDLLKKISDIKIDLKDLNYHKITRSYQFRSLVANGSDPIDQIFRSYLKNFGNEKKIFEGRDIDVKSISLLRWVRDDIIDLFSTIRDSILNRNKILGDWYYYVLFKQN